MLPSVLTCAFRCLTRIGSACVLPWLFCSAQETAPIDSIPVSVIVSDYEELLRQVSYSWDAGAGEGLTNRASGYTKQGVAMLVARTQLKGVSEELLNKLAEQLAANSANAGLKLVTLADLSADFGEAKSGGVRKGTVQDFSKNQVVLNEAISRGIAMVLFVDVTHLNVKRSTVSGAEEVNTVNVRASLTLLNAADGNRIKSINREIQTRGFDPGNLADKAFDLLAKDLSAESARWKLQDLQIRFVQLEVHAKMDGMQFPMMDIDRTGQIQLHEVPLFAEGASVEVDGILKGKAPCRIDVAPGTHRLKVYRDETKPFEAVIQVNADNRCDALLVPSDEMRRKFDEQLKKFEAVKTMAINRNLAQERETVRTDGFRANNENARLKGKAAADLTQSRADVLRKDADSKGKIASGEAAVLNGEAAILNEGSREQANLLNAKADATRKAAEGQLELDKANAKGNVPVINARLDALKEQSAAFKSFAETVGALGFKLAPVANR